MQRRPIRNNNDSNLYHGDGINNNLNDPSNRHRQPRELEKPHNIIIIMSLLIVGFLLLLLFFIIPAVLKIYPPVLIHICFLNHFHWPPFLNLSNPLDSVGLSNAYNFRLKTTDGVEVGAWHILPNTIGRTGLQSIRDGEFLGQGQPIVIYLHGNAGTRAAWHRVQLYKKLTDANFHVVTLDYRGYGDSSGQPSEDGVVADSIKIFEWVAEKSGGDIPIYIWGHSLGSAVATKAAKILNERGVNFDGLILEAPFNNFEEASFNHPLSWPCRYLPWYTWAFIEGLKANNIIFASDQSIIEVKVPTLIMHAEDDTVVPAKLSKKLYDIALEKKERGKIEYVLFDKTHSYGHKHIHKAPELIDIFRKFIESTSTAKKEVE